MPLVPVRVDHDVAVDVGQYRGLAPGLPLRLWEAVAGRSRPAAGLLQQDLFDARISPATSSHGALKMGAVEGRATWRLTPETDGDTLTPLLTEPAAN